MRNMLAGLAALLLLSGCATPGVEVYRNEKPQLDLKQGTDLCGA